MLINLTKRHKTFQSQDSRDNNLGQLDKRTEHVVMKYSMGHFVEHVPCSNKTIWETKSIDRFHHRQ